jgi:uncharacterized membrane-anchored protein
VAPGSLRRERHTEFSTYLYEGPIEDPALVEVEQQNRDVLASMNNRACLQLRLQETVEGLSVAAVSYYIVGLISYLAKGSKSLASYGITSEAVAAVCVPVAVLLVWWGLRRVHRSHTRD